MKLPGRSSLIFAAVAVLAPAAPAAAQTITEDHLSALDYRSIGPTRQSGRFVDIVPSEASVPRYTVIGG